MRKIILSGLLVLMSCVSLFGVTSAVFEETVKVAGVSFSVTDGTGTGGPGETGNTALKILVNNSGSTQSGNLADSKNGPSFSNVTPDWSDVVPIKLHNKGTSKLNVVGSVVYVNDPDTLRDDLNVEVLAWTDTDNDGNVDESELGQSYKKDTILRLKNDTAVLGEINAGATRGFVLKFDGAGVSEANVGQTAVYDFTFTGVEVSQ